MAKIKIQKNTAKGLVIIIAVLLLNACSSHKIPHITPLQAKETLSPHSGRNYVICKNCLEYTQLKEVVVIHTMAQQFPVKKQKPKGKIPTSKAKKQSKTSSVSKPCVFITPASPEQSTEMTTKSNLKPSTFSNLPLMPAAAKTAEGGTTASVEKQELTQTK